MSKLTMSALKSLFVVLTIALTFCSGAYAATVYSKSLAGMGLLQFTGEVTVTEIRVVNVSFVQVTLNSVVLEKAFTVKLYLDNVLSGTTQIAFTSANSIVIDFPGLNLAEVTTICVEVEG